MLTRRTMSRIPLIVSLLALICAPASAYAQEPPPVSGRIEDVDDSDFPTVRAIVTLVDSAGRPISGLGPEDFTATESDAEAGVSGVETVLDQQIGIGVILVIDTSGSMEGEPIAQARSAARSFAENLAPADQAAVVSFANSVQVVSALTPDRSRTLSALDSLVAQGNTALFSGVVEAVEQARAADLPRRAVILLSDGLDFGGASQVSRQAALTQATNAGIPFYVIGLGEDIDRPFLEELAAASKGAFFEAPAPGRIPEIYDQLSQILRSQYVVTLESSAPADREERSLVLRAETPRGSVELSSAYTTQRTIITPPTDTPVPPTVEPTVEPTAAPTVTTTQESDDEGGSSIVLPLLLVVVGAGGVAVGSIYYRRVKQRRGLEQDIESMSRRAADELAHEDYSPPVVTSTGPTRSVLLTGPDGEERIEVGVEPLTLGAGAECQVRLDAGEGGVAVSHARVWLRDGTLMLHHLAPGHETLLAGRPVTWVSLETGDEVQIGPYWLRVEP